MLTKKRPLLASIKGITSDSRFVKRGFAYVAIKGTTIDGNRFIGEAIKKGAKVIILQTPNSKLQTNKNITFIKVKDTRKALAELASEFYGNPSKKIKVVGITGTNGKTTISYLIEAILKEAGSPCGVIGTINYHFKNKTIPAKKTTPGSVELEALLSEMHKAKVRYCAMEVSSHALDQKRTEGIKFRAAIFTNLTQDHLDYHHNLENYFQAKSLLFRGMSKNAAAIINIDDSFGRRLVKLTKAKVLTYAIDALADIKAEDISLHLEGAGFSVIYKNKKFAFKTLLLGRHNIYNILAAISFALSEGIGMAQISLAIAKFKPVTGRLQVIRGPWPFKVFIDYAHTDDALRNVISSLREFAKGRVIVVFGCGGDRDKLKRPKMGRVVCELADYFIITNDNPRSENPKDIAQDIIKGIKKDNYRVILNRKEAIRESLANAKAGDIILIAGKGHETYQVMKDKTILFNDKETALECLRLMRS